jgi:hypothetical protein
VKRRPKITTGLLALITVIFTAGVLAWMLWAFGNPTSGYGAGIVIIFVALLTLLSAFLGVMSLVDKSGRVPGVRLFPVRRSLLPWRATCGHRLEFIRGQYRSTRAGF